MDSSTACDSAFTGSSACSSCRLDVSVVHNRPQPLYKYVCEFTYDINQDCFTQDDIHSLHDPQIITRPCFFATYSRFPTVSVAPSSSMSEHQTKVLQLFALSFAAWVFAARRAKILGFVVPVSLPKTRPRVASAMRLRSPKMHVPVSRQLVWWHLR